MILSSGSGVLGTRITPLFPLSSLCCLHLSQEQARTQGLHPPKKDQPSRQQPPPHCLLFKGELTACWALIKELLITSQSLLRVLISDREPVCKLQCTGCHQHHAGSGWLQPASLRSGAEGFSSLKRENFSAESLARLKTAAKLYHISSFFIPKPQILSSHLTIALQCHKNQVSSHWCFSAARRCMLFLRKQEIICSLF